MVMTDKTIFRIGTRRSTLATTQAQMVKSKILEHFPDLQVEIVPMSTKGDWRPSQGETKLDPNAGGKALWVEDIEKSLHAREIDCAVHSMKDVPSFLSPEFQVVHVLPREDARDAFISQKYKSLSEMPAGSVIGTSSARRKSVLKYLRPDIDVVHFRGNIGTRLKKLEDGQVDAIILAAAGLIRTGQQNVITQHFSIDDMLPSACQGSIGIETRIADAQTHEILSQIHCVSNGYCAAAERSVLKTLDGSCATPIGAYAELSGSKMRLRAFVACPEGHAMYKEQIFGTVDSRQTAIDLGQKLGVRLKTLVPEDILTQVA